MKTVKIFLILFCTILCHYICFNRAFCSDLRGKPIGKNQEISENPSENPAEFLKTSVKRYKVYKYKKDKILCEPYTVSKDDWLYKIFRKKGEISERDFPLFINIFKAFNPGINNIDAIRPGQNILIPLKKIHKNDFNEISPGVVDVPMIEFASIPKSLNQFIIKRKIKKGDTVSKLLDPVFLNKNGSINPNALQILKLSNPDLKDINTIYAGSFINLPSSALCSQPWFKSSFHTTGTDLTKNNTKKQRNRPHCRNKNSKPNQTSSVNDKIHNNFTIQEVLEHYASLTGGELIQSGKLYFPRNNLPDMELDLKSHPVIELPNGEKIIIVTSRQAGRQLSEKIGGFRKNFKIITFATAVNNLDTALPRENDSYLAKMKAISENENIVQKTITVNPFTKTLEHETLLPSDHESAIEKIFSLTSFNYIPDAKINLSFNGINIVIHMGKIQSNGKPDLFVDYGTIYGYAIDIIKKRGSHIISIPAKGNFNQSVAKIFKDLGMSTTTNPVFINSFTKKAMTIPGLYITGDINHLFADGFLIANKKPNKESLAFLNKKNIKVLLYMGAN